MANNLYQDQLVYIPSDLVGNAVIDNIRKRFDLATVPNAEDKLKNLLFANKDKIKIVAVETGAGKKRYKVDVADFTASKEAEELFDKLSTLFGDKNLGGILLTALILTGLFKKNIRELVGIPIFEKDLFFDVSFMAGTVLDKSVILPSDASEQLKNNEAAQNQAAFYYYKIRSYFERYVDQDPFERFSGNTSTKSDLVPSMYKMIESNLLSEPNGTVGVNYSLSEQKSLNHVVFFDLETYNTFLQGCENIAANKLRSLAKFKSTPSSQYQEQSAALGKIEQLPDIIPFYSKVEFKTEKNISTSGFSFNDFFSNPDIKPVFEQLIGLYAESCMFPDKYSGKSWYDKQEEYKVFDKKTGQQVDAFNTRVIKSDPLLKDPSFLSFELSKTSNESACSNIAKKISALLYQKRIKQLLLDTLEDNEKFFLSPNYSETVCYRVTKIDKFTGKASHWFVPNFPSLQTAQIFDTNLRFNRGADFKYEIYALKATVGVDYQYVVRKDKLADAANITSADDLFDDRLIIEIADLTKGNKYPDLFYEVEAVPSVNFIEVPFFEKDGIIVYDSAPANPSLGIYFYRGVDNKATVIFNGFVDEYKDKRVSILQGEDTINDKAEQYGRQFYSFASDELYFKTESEDVNEFQLFVLDTPPKKLQDFAAARKITIKNTIDPIDIEELREKNLPYGSSVTLSDVVPNKDYWLMGRVVDFNGNISNPSVVYKFNITNDDGYINPTKSVFDMTEVRLPPEIQESPSFEKMVYVGPSLAHTIINGNSGEDSPFGKSYKLRITSKKTNKKFDLNVRFDRTFQTLADKKDLPKGWEYEEVLLDAEDPFFEEEFQQDE